MAFTLVGATADEAPLSCGDPQKRSDRVFRWTAAADKGAVKAGVYGISSADLVVEVFSAAPCTGATSVACNNDESGFKRLPEAQFTAKSGKTYFIVVSSFGPAPIGRFYLYVND